MDEFELEINDDFDMGSAKPTGKLPDINRGQKTVDREKASNLFTAMSAAIEQEQAKQGSSHLNAIDRQWESRGIARSKLASHQNEEESSDSFDMDVDNDAFTGVYNQKNKQGKPVENSKQAHVQDDSDDEFGIVDDSAAHQFKKLDKNNLKAYLNDPTLSNDERKQYQQRINDLKGKKKDIKQKNNIKGAIIVENDEDEGSEDEEMPDINQQQKGKINQIFDSTMGEYTQKQKELERLQKEKEATALAKIDVMKAERSKNKVISSVGKGLVTNNLSAKLKSISQNKEYDASKLVQEESKIANIIPGQKALAGANSKQINLIRKEIIIKGKRVGCSNFHQAALKCNLKIPNVFLKNQVINILDIKSEESKIANPPKVEKALALSASNQNLHGDSSPAVKPVVANQMSKFY